MVPRSSKTPVITNADKPSIIANPGTLVFNSDTDELEFINNAFSFVPVSAGSNVITQQIWVNAASGNDANDGSINAPFATYDAARLFAKVTASPTNNVLINIIGDQSITGDFIISPYIIVNGNKSGVITATGDIILDTDFLVLSSLITKVIGCSFIANALTITWGSGDQNILVFNESDFINVPSFTEASPNTNAFGNGVAIIGSGTPFYLPFNTLFSVKDALFAASNCQLAGLPELIATGTQTPRMSFIQSGGYGQISIDGTGASGSPTVFLRSCDPTGVNLMSSNAQLVTDVVSLNNDALNFSGGATISQVQFNTQLEPSLISTSLYTPTNYTPTSPDSRVGQNSVTSHLNGINSALFVTLQSAYNNGSLINLGIGGLLEIDDSGSANSIHFNGDLANPLMQIFGTTNSTIPYSVLTDAQFASLSSLSQGMIGYTTTSNRLSVFDGMGVRNIAYIEDTNQSGTFTPGITNVSNTSSISFIKGMYSATGLTTGKVVTCSLEFSCTVSSTAGCTVQIASLPVNPGNFVNNLQAMTMGGTFYTNVSPAIGDGLILDVISNTGTTTLNFSFIPATTSGTKVITISFMYVIQ
jgi:hypothetical protein